MVSDILKSEFNVSEEFTEYKDCIYNYKVRLNEFLYSITLFNVWYCAMKRKAERNKLLLNVSLDNQFPKTFVKVSLDSIIVSYDYDKIESSFSDAIKLTQREINNVAKTFSKADLSLLLRGKYIFHNLFLVYSRLLLQDANDKTKRKFLKKSIKYNFDSGLALSQLSQYASTPSCLVDFIVNYNK